MPFAKHQGTLLADPPGNYLTCFPREGFPKGEIGRLLALVHEMGHHGLRDLFKPLSRLGVERLTPGACEPPAPDPWRGRAVVLGLAAYASKPDAAS